MRKLNRPTAHRISLVKNLATNLLWYGKIETTLEKAKEVKSYAEKVLTKAINTYLDTVKVTKDVVNEKGEKIKKEVVNDGPKKLVARRQIMSMLHDIQEVRASKESKADFVKRTEDIKHPLIEKIFNVYAPKYAQRKETLGTAGGYTRVVKLGTRNGDCAEMAIIELV